MIIESFVTNKLYNNYIDQVDNDEYKDSFFDYCGEECQNYYISEQFELLFEILFEQNSKSITIGTL